MTDQQHPITPSPDLTDKWNNLPLSTEEIFVIVARWGADQELEACCEYIAGRRWQETFNYQNASNLLRAARRPKPPSLKDQALAILDDADRGDLGDNEMAIIRRALEQLDTQAARWGADQELEACVDWMSGSLPRQAADQLRRVELIDCLKKADWPHRYKVVFQQWMDIAHAALAEPEGEGPTDEQLNDISARRPKPPSLAEQALEVFEALIHGDESGLDVGVIRRALERLQDLEKGNE